MVWAEEVLAKHVVLRLLVALPAAIFATVHSPWMSFTLPASLQAAEGAYVCA